VQVALFRGGHAGGRGHAGGGDHGAVVVHVPGCVVVQRSEWGAVAGGEAVGDHGEHAEAEGVWELAHVGGDLGLGGADARGGPGVLQLHHHHGHAVEVEHHVEPALDLSGHHGDLVDGEPLVLFGVGAQQADGGVVFGTVGDVGEAVALGEVVVDA